MDFEEKTDFKKSKDCSFSWKVMATVFWDSHKVILIDYLQKGRIVPGRYYVSLYDKLQKELQKFGHVCRRKILFHRDNTPCFTRQQLTWQKSTY